MKILHSADWHLDSPLAGRDPELKQALLAIPGKIADLVKTQQCDLVLLSGDLFDGTPSLESLRALRQALEEMAVPVFISPGNHDFCAPDSPWLTEAFSRNVHIFIRPSLESVSVPELDCRVYGAGYEGMDCPALLEDFRAEGPETYKFCVLHGDPTVQNSPYCSVTARQVRQSGLDYLALGHIHQTGSFTEGRTLCAWPGCPMGRGFDELGIKGVLLVTVEDSVHAEFLSLDTPRFYDLSVPAGDDPEAALEAVLPPTGSRDYYRITLSGECETVSLPALSETLSRFPHLELRDRTTPPVDLWASAGEDSLEGVYFRMLRQALDAADGPAKTRIELAAKLSRRILDGQEVSLS